METKAPFPTMGFLVGLFFFLAICAAAWGAEDSKPATPKPVPTVRLESTGEWFPFRVLCSTCQKVGHKSNVYPGGCWRTAMGISTYYDTAGRLVFNDPNTTTCDYRCSRGHSWKETY